MSQENLYFNLLWDFKTKKEKNEASQEGSGKRELKVEGKKKAFKYTEPTLISCLTYSGHLAQDMESELETFRVVLRPRTPESNRFRLKL